MELKDKNNNISIRYFAIVALMAIVAISVIAKAGFLMFVKRGYWEKVADRFVKEDVITKPTRGNILSEDGKLMASSLPEYRIYLDFMTSESKKNPQKRSKDQHRRDTLLENNIDEICKGLHRIFPDKSVQEFKKHLREGRKKGSRNYPIYPKRISYIQYKEVKKLPMFRLSPYRGGFKAISYNQRKKPFGSLAMRTLGTMFPEIPDSAKNGIELAYDSILRGKTGLTHRQKVMNKYLNIVDIPAEDGCDIVSTINVNMQDIAEKALIDKMKELNADMGVVILMEVATGEIRAIVNMSLANDGKYYEMHNHAISTRMEPGSTFKTASMLVALDDGVIDTTDVIDTGCGVYKMHGANMKDHNWGRGGYQQLTVPEILMVSSNIGISRIIDENYQNNPGKFVDGLYRVGIGEALDLELPGAQNPIIRHPKDGNWWKTTLPWMSIGYETQIAPISTLTFYNAIANDGVMVKPRFVKSIVKNGEIIKEFEPIVLKSSICSESALHKIQDILEMVVSKGLGKQAGSKQFHVSGKTGTAQVSQGKAGYKSGRMQYLVSFCGYFPSEKPQYSCIVAMRKYGYPASGGSMAGPVFSRIAERVMAGKLKKDIEDAIDSCSIFVPNVKNGNLNDALYLLEKLDVSCEWEGKYSNKNVFGQANITNKYVQLNRVNSPFDRVPNVKGMGAKDAVYLLESRGLKVHLKGKGVVQKQSLPKGHHIKKGEHVYLVLN